jgi:hypothetical protein
MVLSEIDQQDRAQAPLSDLPSSGGRCGACSARPSRALLDAARGRDLEGPYGKTPLKSADRNSMKIGLI